MDAFEPSESLREAFCLGEAPGAASRQSGASLYQTILQQCPDCLVAWFNLGVLQSRLGLWKAAAQSFLQAEQSSDMRVLAAFSRLRLLVENGQDVSDEDLPREFRGKDRIALGVQGPCQNAVSELRNRGYDCTVEGKGTSCSISCTVGSARYTITVYDLAGMLMKNVYREEGGSRVNLGEANDLSELDREFACLSVGRLALAQIPVGQQLDRVNYMRLRQAASAGVGPHGWARQGRSFDEAAAQDKAEAAQRGVKLVRVVTIDDIAKKNWIPGTVFTCVLDGTPHAVAMLEQLDAEHIPFIKESVGKGICLFDAELFPMPEYPIIHLGMGIPVRALSDSQIACSLLESAVDFTEGNFQDWLTAIEAKGVTEVHVFGPDRSRVASGRVRPKGEIVVRLVEAVKQADAAFRQLPETTRDFRSAQEAFFEQHPEPFL